LSGFGKKKKYFERMNFFSFHIGEMVPVGHVNFNQVDYAESAVATPFFFAAFPFGGIEKKKVPKTKEICRIFAIFVL
jgi:hypothetical protein